MPVDLTALNKTIADLEAQVTKTEGTEESAGLVIQAFADAIKTAVTDALEADAAANAESVKAATDAITAVQARFAAADDKLGAAIIANPGPAKSAQFPTGGRPSSEPRQ
jgi:hypothetical protein